MVLPLEERPLMPIISGGGEEGGISGRDGFKEGGGRVCEGEGGDGGEGGSWFGEWMVGL